ncbi:protein-glutamine gamma-glutamyltransferase 5-like [Scomber japonicus]|uniref:protein-glutamine gamma-glutamyltransferase 5-like n=1 Tax=Scomber japonicus TaxID=13676 RepID=UPI00230626BD|nr:protein-glutamine gamma-glutamyltransferase 5-like [Scomber japonicus]
MTRAQLMLPFETSSISRTLGSSRVFGPVRLYQEATAEVMFMNPVQETLKDCVMTISGSGLLRREFESRSVVFIGVDLHCKTNNTEHRTNEISVERLIVRRGQPFILTLKLSQSFNHDLHPLTITAETGEHPSEERGTKSSFAVPDNVRRSSSAKAVWKMEIHNSFMGSLTLSITPPADAPIGEYRLTVKHKDDEALLATPAVLFNPWCPDDWVFLPDEAERQEYVMNEQGIIYKGSGNYLISMTWDYGQFEDNMVEICLKILDKNNKHLKDPADDVSARCNPIYVGRVVSAMINSQDDNGILMGRWSNEFWGGVPPTHWSGSHDILQKWYNRGCYPVKYGQCWVFAGVMCSVMRLLGIPCRVITNYQSAHDSNRNLIIDVNHADYGVKVRPSKDSIWNYHVWVEAWMRRPDLTDEGKYDGWQVLDPTPQELSDGVYCCGPAPVKAVLNGDTDLKYDVPFVFAEVNADCIDWLVLRDGSKQKITSDTKRVGQNISTKSVGSNKRMNITDSYKHREGTTKERSVFKSAVIGLITTETEGNGGKEETGEENGGTGGENGGTEGTGGENGGTEGTGGENGGTGGTGGENGGTEGTGGENGGTGGTGGENGGQNGGTEGNGEVNGNGGDTNGETPTDNLPPPKVSMRFDEVSAPVNGQDVHLNLVLNSKSKVSRSLAITTSVQGMTYYGSPVASIQTDVKYETLLPGKDLIIPIVVPFSAYNKYMKDFDSMKVSVIVTDKEKPIYSYLAEDDVVLLDPPISIKVVGPVRLYRETTAEVLFMNPVQETLKDCVVTISGSGLLRREIECRIPNLPPNHRVLLKLPLIPYKLGQRTLVADFDCSFFRNAKGSATVYVQM